MSEDAGMSGPPDPGTLDWDGEQGEFWVREQERRDRTLAPFVGPLLDAAGVGEGSAVLDVGCGCGATTRAAGARGAAPVVGIDVSTPMLDRARELTAAESLGEVEFVRADAQTHRFAPESFDVVLSRFGVMFFDDPTAAFTSLASALRLGGRLAFVCWQEARRNPHISMPMREIVTAFPEALPRDTPQPPFSMSDPDEVRALLTGAGLSDVELRSIEQELRVGDDVDQVLGQVLSGPMPRRLLAPQPSGEVEQVAGRIRERLAESVRDDGVYLGSAAWLVTARR